MNIVCIIPARGGSKGIKNKNIAPLNGKPLIAYSIEQALCDDRLIDNVYITSDSNKILEVGEHYGASSIVRPDELSTDACSSETSIDHAIKEIKKTKPVDVVVFLQATSPLRENKDIKQAIDYFIESKADSLFSSNEYSSGYLWKRNPETKKLESFNYDYKNRKRRQDKDIEYVENGSIYIFKAEKFLKYQNRLFENIVMYEMEPWKEFEIDEPDDLIICEQYILQKLN